MTEAQQCELICVDITSMKEQNTLTLNTIKETTTKMAVLTKEQRDNLSDLKLATSRAERKF